MPSSDTFRVTSEPTLTVTRMRPACAWWAVLDNASPKNGQEVIGDVDVDRFDGAIELEAGFEPQLDGGVGDDLEQPSTESTRRGDRTLEREDRGAQVFDRRIKPVDG
jgi:hypothetical protein